MKRKEFEDLVRKVSYKPGWSFEAITIWQPEIWVTVFFDVEDVDGSGVVWRHQKTRCYKIDDDSVEPRAILDAIGEMVAKIEDHERNEWLRWDRVPIQDPHPELRRRR